MRRSGKALLVVTVVTTLGVAGTVLAYADAWTLAGNRCTFTARVATMPRGVEPSVAKRSGQAVVAWSAQEIVPGVLMDHYVVTAHSASSPPRPELTRTVAAAGADVESVTFAAGQLAEGGWRWTVIPRYRLWAGAESKPSRKLTFPPAPAPVAATARSAGPAAAASPSGPAPASPSSGPAPTSPPSRPAPTSPPSRPASDESSAPGTEPLPPRTSRSPEGTPVPPVAEALPPAPAESAPSTLR